MIVLRKPVRLFDVDLLGIGLTIILAAIAYGGVWRPWQATGLDRTARESAWRSRSSVLDQRRLEREQLESEIAQLSETLHRCAQRTPQLDQWSQVVTAVLQAAQECGLAVRGATPDRPKPAGSASNAELSISGHGSAEALLRLLAMLAERWPAHEVLDYSIRDDDPTITDGATAEVALRLRFSLLPNPALAQGPRP